MNVKGLIGSCVDLSYILDERERSSQLFKIFLRVSLCFSLRTSSSCSLLDLSVEIISVLEIVLISVSVSFIFFVLCNITNLERGQDATIGTIEKKIAGLTFLPVEYGEGFEVLRYEVGQKFGVHYDYPIGEHFTKDGGHTVATIVIYIPDVEEGGEEVFPLAKGNISALACWNGKYTTHDGKGSGGLFVKPKMGDALLFWNIKPDGTMDLSSLYG
ncbi:putative procollagen-proline 4-dioxygenase [Helianthus debilis subsp. tardiflorus]